MILEKLDSYSSGDTVGVVKVYLGSKEVLERNVFIDVLSKKSNEKKNFFSKILSWFKLW